MSELERIVAGLETVLSRCRAGLLRSDELQNALSEAAGQALSAVSDDSDAYRILDRGLKETTVWTQVTVSGYANPTDCAQIAKRRELLLKVLNSIEPEFLRDVERPKRQYYFEAGEAFRPMRLVYSILRSAQSSVELVDEYLDADIFDYVRSLDVGLQWRLLTGLKKPIFPRLLAPTVADGFQVEARENTVCHDRFIVIDGGTSIWHLGASLNGLGKKAFMLNEVTEGGERSSFLSDFKTWWAAGTVIN